MVNRKKVETVTDFIFFQAMINLDSILNSKDITLPTKACVIKAMVFPVVMYRCEIWTIKKDEHQRMMLLKCGIREDS